MTMGLDNMDHSNSGGVGAKKGVLFQDYVAALYVTEMLRDKRIKGVCCEVKDDVDIIYENHVRFIQIKTTDGDKKWSTKELCQRTKKKDSNRYNQDSIVHKSLNCDSSDKFKAMFGIISTRDVDSTLLYLKIEHDKRFDKTSQRDKLINSITRQIKEFRSNNNNDIAYWVDNCEWNTFHNSDHIKLLCLSNIMKCASENGFYLDPNHDDEIILNSILAKVNKLSTLSKKEFLSKDKTYFRADLITWFQAEIERISEEKPHKVYKTKSNNLPTILNELNKLKDSTIDTISGTSYYQSYNRLSYRFDFISTNLVQWLPELLLRPEELSTITPTNMISRVRDVYKTISENNHDIKNIISRVLLHSLVRHHCSSQPIPAHLYTEKKGDMIDFDNIHIVIRENDPDEMWFGLSLWCDGNIEKTVSLFASKVLSFVDVTCDTQRKIILDIKSDEYLVKHDVNCVLDPATSITDHLSRIYFVVFIGYISETQTLEVKKDYEENLKEEVLLKFKSIIEELIHNYDSVIDLNFIIYMYPLPCIDSLVDSFKNKMVGDING